MKKKSLFMMGMAMLAFSACSNDDVMTESGKIDAAIESGDLTYMTIKVGSGANTRIGTGNAESGGAESKDIKNFHLFVFDAQTKVLEVNEEYTVDADGLTKTMLVTPGNKKVYVLANIKNNMTEVYGEIVKSAFPVKGSDSTLDNFLEKIHTLADTGASLTSLVNAANGYVMGSLEKDATKTFQAGVVTPSDGNNLFTVNLYYMLSKLNVKLKTEAVLGNLGSDVDGALSSPECVVRNIAKKTYLIQKDPIQGFYYSQKPSDESDASAWLNFYKVPTFTGFQRIGLDVADTGLLMTENVNQDAKIGNTTYAAIRAKFLPTAGSVVVDASWDELTKRISLTKGNLGGNGTFVRSIGSYSGLSAGTIFKDVATAKNAIAIAKKQGVVVDADKNAVVENTDYYIYTNGICYYRMNVGESGTTNTDDVITKNGVERGRAYVATINKITGLGFNTEGKLDGSDTTGGGNTPDQPLDQNTNISVSIVAKGWVTTPTEGELN